LNVKGIELPD
jgi:hypothetical protein